MLKNSNLSFSAARLAEIYEVLEPGYIYGRQWDCSSVVDLFLTLYQYFIHKENFDGKINVQEMLNSLKVTMIVSTQCKICSTTKKKEFNDFFFFVPLVKNVHNIFRPFYDDINGYACEICNALAGNPHPRLTTGAVQKTYIKSLSNYVLIKFGRVKLNFEKVSHTVTVRDNTFVLGHHFQLEAWVEHIGHTIKSGHYVLIRRVKQSYIKMSDDYFSTSQENYILNSKLCYIAVLRRL